MRPRLLISVRDAGEAAAALAGGCDWLDIKEPAGGWLGRPEPQVIAEILKVRDHQQPAVPVSVALGDGHELLPETVARYRVLFPRLAAIKIGCAGPHAHLRAAERWQQLLAALEVPWIAVAAADISEPAIREVLRFAVEYRARGLLIDTWDKAGPGLTGWLSAAAITEYSREVHAGGLLFSVAGKLQLHELHELRLCGCDLLGVRSAACEESQRQGRVNAARVRALRAATGAPNGRLPAAAQSLEQSTEECCRASGCHELSGSDAAATRVWLR